jgi:stage III sporulation protein SpoIIIAA
MTQHQITDDLPAFFAVLPNEYLRELKENNNVNDLLEIIMDLGRLPTARFVNLEIEIHNKEVSREQIDELVSRIGDFDADNRAGIERTLHRISAMRNKHGDVVGLTCRVGRAVYGTIDIIEDLVDTGKSILLLGRPGIGKTTMLREVARILGEKTRVVIVDTSNEIGGDGDVPHPAVGRARRMQVAKPSLQHEVMIEAVENHNPEVIIIDEIGRELEASAARTIAERGVQLVATAHGRTLENLLLNPTLSDLIGGIESVTLSDEEARRRGTQKTVLERRSPPTFDVLVEIQERDRLAVRSVTGWQFMKMSLQRWTPCCAVSHCSRRSDSGMKTTRSTSRSRRTAHWLQPTTRRVCGAQHPADHLQRTTPPHTAPKARHIKLFLQILPNNLFP